MKYQDWIEAAYRLVFATAGELQHIYPDCAQIIKYQLMYTMMQKPQIWNDGIGFVLGRLYNVCFLSADICNGR